MRDLAWHLGAAFRNEEVRARLQGNWDGFLYLRSCREELKLLRHPMSAFREALRKVQSRQDKDRRPIAVSPWRGPPTANAESFSREPRFLGYKIRINRTFYPILDAAIEFFDARHVVVSRTGDVVRPVTMPIDEYAEALRTSIREYVLGRSPTMESFALGIVARRAGWR